MDLLPRKPPAPPQVLLQKLITTPQNSVEIAPHLSKKTQSILRTLVSSLSTCELRKSLQDMKKKNTELHESLSSVRKKLKTATRRTKRLEKDLSTLTENWNFLNEYQKAALKRKSQKGSAWSAETIKKALQLKFACGSAGYDLLIEQGNPLPSRRTLFRRLQHLSFKPGVLTEIVNMMKVKVAAMTNIEKDCVLFLDEMEIRKGVELDRSGDGFIGKTTLSETNQAANHVLVFMVGGLNMRWKQVIAYHFAGAFVNGEKLRDFVFDLIKLCTNISLRVLCVTCDMGSSNRAMWRSLNLSSSRYSVTTCTVPYPCDNSMSLFFMPDPSHVLKNIRGHLVRKDPIKLGDEIVAKYNLPSSDVSIDHVEALLKFDTEQLKVAPHLSTLHISNGHFTKMKVGVAVQLFREAPAAIRYLVEQKKLPPEAGTTAWFCEVIFKWYTIMTARHPLVALSLSNESKYEEAVSTLTLSVEVMESLGIGIKKVWKPCQAGVLMSTAVVLQLHEFLLKKCGYILFLTGRLAQDCLENLFSVIRMISPVPSAYDVKNALRIVSVSQFLKVPKNAGYEADNSNYLVDFFSAEIKEVQKEFQEPSYGDDCTEVESLSPVESDIVAHLAGYLVKPFISTNKPCSTCTQNLIADEASDEHALVQLKEYNQGSRNLMYVSRTVLHFVSSCESVFKKFSEENDICRLDHPIKTLTSLIERSVSLPRNECTDHPSVMEKLMCRFVVMRLRIYLRWLSEPDDSDDGYGSKTVAGVNLS